MEIKTSELRDVALNWAVAKCEGYEYNPESGLLYKFKEPHFLKPYSTDWIQAGPILERESIGFAKYGPDGTWKAVIGETPRGKPHYGETALIATMRCYVASKLGDEVEVPDEITRA